MNHGSVASTCGSEEKYVDCVSSASPDPIAEKKRGVKSKVRGNPDVNICPKIGLQDQGVGHDDAISNQQHKFDQIVHVRLVREFVHARHGEYSRLDFSRRLTRVDRSD
jgi:hypothetical protein